MIKTLCFLATYQCNAKCDFCECRPTVKDRIELSEMIRLIDEAYALGTVYVVVFSGGEPTLLKDDLLKAIQHATSKGLLTRVVTNGWWGGKRIEQGRAYLDKLIQAGLSEINISVDDLHQEWIDIEHVKNAFLACYERRFRCLIAHKQTRQSKITKSYLEAYFGVDLVDYDASRQYSEDEQARLISTSVVVPVGPVNAGKEADYEPENLLSLDWTRSCGSVLRDIIIGAKGNFLPCCGFVTKNTPELTREDLRQSTLLDAIDNANRDLMLNWIALEGPATMAKFAQSKNPSIHLESSYTSICHICNEVLTRNDIRQAIADNLEEIKQRVAYQRVFLEKARTDQEVVKAFL